MCRRKWVDARATRGCLCGSLQKNIFVGGRIWIPRVLSPYRNKFQRTPKNVQLSPKPLCGRRAKMPGVKNVKNSESFFVGVFSPPPLYMGFPFPRVRHCRFPIILLCSAWNVAERESRPRFNLFQFVVACSFQRKKKGSSLRLFSHQKESRARCWSALTSLAPLPKCPDFLFERLAYPLLKLAHKTYYIGARERYPSFGNQGRPI